MTTLKPCPFCGGAPKVFEHDHIEGYYVACFKGCGISARLHETPEPASAAWNHRPGEQAVAEEIARYVEDDRGLKELAKTIRARFGGKA